jgi:hypothetical protein
MAQRSGSWRATAVPCSDVGRDASARRLLLQAQSLLAKKTGNRKGNRTITEEMLLYLELPLFL